MIFHELKPGLSVAGEKIKAFLSDTKGSKFIYLMAGAHGDEVEGIYVLQQLFDHLQKSSDIDLPLVIIPVLNVDGLRANTRVNARGVDLNRNYPSDQWSEKYIQESHYPGTAPLSEPENQYLLKLFNKHPPGFILSFHSWKPMLNYNGDCLDVANFLHKYNSYEIVGEFTDHPTPGSLGELDPTKFNASVLTFECPLIDQNKTLKDIWAENEQGLYYLLKSDLLKDKVKTPSSSKK